MVSLPRVVTRSSSTSVPSASMACARIPRESARTAEASMAGTNFRISSTKAEVLTADLAPRAAVFAVCAANFQNPLKPTVDPISPRSKPCLS